MPTLTLYPTTLVSGNEFTTAQLANVVGNTTNYALHTGAVNTNASLDGRFYFDMSAFPADAVINSMTFGVRARSTSATLRKMYSFDFYFLGTGEGKLVIVNTSLTTADADYTGVLSAASLGATLDKTNYYRGKTIEWTAGFISTGTTSTSTYWQKFWITLDYTLLGSGKNALFLGENF